MGLPARRQRRRRVPGPGFHVEPCISGQPAALLEGAGGGFVQVCVVGRIEKNKIVGLPWTAIPQPAQQVRAFAARPLAFQRLQVSLQLVDAARILLDKIHPGGPPGQRFQPQGAAAGKRVQAMPASDCRRQPVEQGLAHPVGCRPQALRCGKTQFPAAPFTADNAQLAAVAGALCRHYLAFSIGDRIRVFQPSHAMKLFGRNSKRSQQDAAPDAAGDAGSTPGEPATPAGEPPAKSGFFSRLRQGLSRTSEQLSSGLGRAFLGRKQIDAALLEELETALLQADVGVDTTLEIIGKLTERVSRKDLTDTDALYAALREELLAVLAPCEQPLQPAAEGPFVILMVGVNGAGKTTTIGKLASRYKAQGKRVMLAAGDTFRAAAVEQLQAWGQRHEVPVIAQHTGADSASVIFDALQAAQARGTDVLIADTAGRLHNKDNLMDELSKVVRVLGKLDAAAPHEIMLVLDAGMGQNALAQAEHFLKAVGVTGIVLTKLDGTAKGGIIFAIARKLGLPIRFVGVGEQAEDLRPFAAQDFIAALFGDDPEK